MRALVESSIGFQAAAIFVVLAEAALAGMLWLRPTWKIAAPLGIAFHAGIIATGLEIGMFAWVMVALYVLVLPDRWFRWTPPVPRHGKPWPLVAGALVVATAAALLVRFPDALAVAIVLALVPLAIAWRTRPAFVLAIAHAAAIVLWIAVDRTSSTALDYYKYWSGTHRRLAQHEDRVVREHHRALAVEAYRAFVAFDPHNANPHFHLGRLLLELGDHAEGLEHLRDAQRLDPTQARAFLAEAYFQSKQNQRDLALTAARGAVAAEPTNREATRVLDSLQRAGTVAPPKGTTDDD
jgi:tetratricopeptide (TPR) repeat protein